MSGPSANELEPVPVDGVGAVAVGTGLWLVALLAALLMRDRLAAAGQTWAIWTCVAGVIVGAIMWAIVWRRHVVYREHRLGAERAGGPA